MPYKMPKCTNSSQNASPYNIQQKGDFIAKTVITVMYKKQVEPF